MNPSCLSCGEHGETAKVTFRLALRVALVPALDLTLCCCMADHSIRASLRHSVKKLAEGQA
ncbi:MAG: hypothetical protein WC736_06265 [Gallionella sp.]|jgi:hypothetical protein